MYKLRHYQEEAVEAALRAFDKNKPFIVQAATGAGKSLMIAEICHRLNEPVLILQPSKELLEQNYDKLKSYRIADIGRYSASVRSKEISKYTYATIGSIYRSPDLFRDFKYVLIDECFVGSTQIDGVRIDTIAPGDLIRSYNHKTNTIEVKMVEAVSKKLIPSKMYCIDVSGESIISTPDHPFFVIGKGYVQAQKIKLGDIVYAIKKESRRTNPLHRVRSNSDGEGLSSVLEVHQNGQDIPQGMQPIGNRSSVFSENEGEESNGKDGYSEKDVRYLEENRTQTTCSWWERNWVKCSTTNALGESWTWLDTGITHKNYGAEVKSWSLPYRLQSRSRKSIPDDCSGGRWKLPFWEKTSKRQKERREAEPARVESITILEQGGDGRFGESNLSCYVYNLQVKDNNNYFAGGVLVHNCHGVNPKNMSGMYTQFLKAIDCKKICGLTATPYRITQKYEKDKKGFLYSTSVLKTLMRIGHPCFWSGGIVYKVETPELIAEGFLSPIDYIAPHVDLTDLKVNSTGADYTEHSLECFWDDRRLRALADTIQEIDGKCQRNLIFCGSIRQGERACEMLNQYWLDAKMVTGETPAKEREQIVADFRAGKFKHLINVSCFTTGFDVPELDSIVLARPTMSLALYYQMVGRGVRLDPNRPDKRLKVYDLAGCTERLGKVESIRLVKNETGYQDQVVSDAGLMSDKPLFSFQVPGKGKLANASPSAP